jgi:hypothetical protein
MKQRGSLAIFKNTGFQVTFVIVVSLLLGNVSPLVDCLLHSNIAYFDSEHLIVGSITTVVSLTGSSILVLYVRRLNRALDTIGRLEGILPICSNCKKIRKSGADPKVAESWQPIESYISEKTSSKFSHGMCPVCMATLYPEYGSSA